MEGEVDNEEESGDALTSRRVLKFLLPSLVGIAIFLFPFQQDGNSTILLGIVTDLIKVPLQPYAIPIMAGVICLSTVAAWVYWLLKPDWKETHPTLYGISYVTPVWLAVRTLSGLAAVSILFQVGPEFIWGADTGTFVYSEIAPAVLYIVFIALFLMPLLTDFGFMDLVGRLVRRPFRVLFRLPGYSAVDATAYFVAAASVGLMITVSQHEKGVYSGREAAAIATNFTVVSIPFCLVVASVTGLEHMFFTWYLWVIAACLICATVTVRLPPLSRLPDTYRRTGNAVSGRGSDGLPIFKSALIAACNRAGRAAAPRQMIRDSWLVSTNLLANIMGATTLVGTLTLILVQYTAVFDYIAWPISFVLGAIGVDNAQVAAPAFFLGFFDMYMPAIVASGLDSEKMRFILAGLSVSQIIFMSDMGVIILRSNLPLRLRDLVATFALRTVILTPIFTLAAAIVF